MQSQAVDYAIVAFHRGSGNLQVVFHHRGDGGGIPFSIALKKDETGAYPSGAALDEEIRRHIPYDMLAAGRAGLAPVTAFHSLAPTRLFEAGMAFIDDEQAFLFTKRPLLRNNGLPLPIDVY